LTSPCELVAQPCERDRALAADDRFDPPRDGGQRVGVHVHVAPDPDRLSAASHAGSS
jgi:hypothetical protein